jgi:hypothetical protein
MRRLFPLAALVFVSLAAGCGGEHASPPYAAVVHDTAETRRVFALEGIVLEPKSRAPGIVATFGDRNDILEVDVFGDPQKVRETGFRDVGYKRHCAGGNGKALRWKNNVRAIVNCDLTRQAALWVSRVERAFGHL